MRALVVLWIALSWMAPLAAGPAPTERLNPLVEAIESGDREVALRLVAELTDEEVDYPIGRWGEAPLHLAVRAAGRKERPFDTAVVEALLARGADPNLRDNEGRSPLFLVNGGAEGALELLRLLLARGASLGQPDRTDRTPLHVYVKQRSIPLIEEALAHGADIEAGDFLGATPLMAAAAWGYVDVVERLLAAGANLHATDKRGGNAMMHAGSGGLPVIDLLVERGLSVDDSNTEGYGLFSVMVMHRKWAEMRVLLERGADPSVRLTDYPSLGLYLLTHPELGMADLIDPRKVDVNAKSPGGGSPLTLALRRKRVAEVERLIELGIDVNAIGVKGMPAVPMVASMDPNREEGVLPMLRLLLDAGADIEARDRWKKMSGLEYAVEAGYPETVALLMRRGAAAGEHMVERALREGKRKTALALVEGGAPVDRGSVVLWAELLRLARDLERADDERALTDEVALFSRLFAEPFVVELMGDEGEKVEATHAALKKIDSAVVSTALSKVKFERPLAHLLGEPTVTPVPQTVLSTSSRQYPAEAKLHVVGLHRGAPPVGVRRAPWWAHCEDAMKPPTDPQAIHECHAKYANQHAEEQVTVTLTAGDSPVILAMMAYQPVHWVVRNEARRAIAGVILGGYYGQRVSGVGVEVPVDVYTHEYSECGICQIGDGYFYAYDRDSAEFYTAMKRLRKITGRTPVSFQGRNQGRAFSIADRN